MDFPVHARLQIKPLRRVIMSSHISPRSVSTWLSMQALGVLVALCGCGQYAGNSLSTADAKHAVGPPSSVVFYSARDKVLNQIYKMDPDGSNQVRVMSDAAVDVDPDISPDGKQIIFTSNQTGNNDIYL